MLGHWGVAVQDKCPSNCPAEMSGGQSVQVVHFTSAFYTRGTATDNTVPPQKMEKNDTTHRGITMPPGLSAALGIRHPAGYAPDMSAENLPGNAPYHPLTPKDESATFPIKHPCISER